MPGGNRRGPEGMGPMTGRAEGHCSGHPYPGFISPEKKGEWGGGYGLGRLGGRSGRRHRHWYSATGMSAWQLHNMGFPLEVPDSPETPVTKDMTLSVLRHQAQYFENMLEDIKAQIKKVEASGKEPETS